MGSMQAGSAVAREAPPETRVVKKLAAGARGAQRWQRRYGDQLVCVRYRDSQTTGERLVTVEIVVDRWATDPPGDAMVWVRIDRDEADVRARAKAGGAQFDWHKRLWIMQAHAARQMGLARRIVRASEGMR
jgi:hypothetical protein